MINHVRTRILNAKHTDMLTGDNPTYIDPSFRPVHYPTHIIELHELIFGGLDIDQRNTAVNLLLHFIQSTFLDTYITKKDPRITYDLSELLNLNEIWTNWISRMIENVMSWYDLNQDSIIDNYDNSDELFKIATQFSDNLTRICALILLVFCYG